jgi:predicted ATPase
MTVYVERLQVEEGFMAGLDLRFSPGLNVVIGSRGVGKTSVIELIRYCLGVRGITDESDERSRQHALSVLGAGQVTVTLRDGENEVTVSRTSSEEVPRSSGRFRPPLVYSQAEIERVGLEARGRLRILDGFVDSEPEENREEKAIESVVRSLTLQVRQFTQELESAREQIALLESAPEELKLAVQAQQTLLKTVQQSEKQQQRVKELGAQIAAGSVKARQIDQAIRDLEAWRTSVSSVVSRPPRISEWPTAAGPEDLLSSLRKTLLGIARTFDTGLQQLNGALESLGNVRAKVQADVLKLEDDARKLRRELEQLKTGAGTAAQRVAGLQEKVGHLEALKSRAKELADRLSETRQQRGESLAKLQRLRDTRFGHRTRVAKVLTEELGPAIEVNVEQGGDSPGYVAAIQSAIRGSGLHHSTLAPQLAQAMSPRELAEAVESGDGRTIANLASIAEDRATKLVQAIARAGTEDIITAPVYDSVTMKLLDGREYKATTNLSMGQRCTVVLSVLLGYQARGLVIDQPEDHLDNSFIVTTLIGAIRRRKPQTQMIFTTHNANIPVLGEADLVVCMGSDGQRGFVRDSGRLDEPDIVRAITSVMEGGHEAFERRAKFYREHLSDETQ